MVLPEAVSYRRIVVACKARADERRVELVVPVGGKCDWLEDERLEILEDLYVLADGRTGPWADLPKVGEVA